MDVIIVSNHKLQGRVLERDAEIDDNDRWVSDVIAALNVTEDIPSLMDGLTTSMTTYLRKPYSESHPHDVGFGEMSRLESYIKVHWPWLTFLLSLLVLTVFLVAATVWKMLLLSSQAWKTSSLAILFHGLEEAKLTNDNRDGQGDDTAPDSASPPYQYDSTEEMSKAADTMNVRLMYPSDQRFKLVHGKPAR